MVLGKKFKVFIGTVGMMRGKKLKIDSIYGTVSKELGTVGEESENIMGYRVIVWA